MLFQYKRIKAIYKYCVRFKYVGNNILSFCRSILNNECIRLKLKMADSPESQSIEKAIQTILKDFDIEVNSYLADLDAKMKMIEGKMTQIVDQQLYKLPEKYRSMNYDEFVTLCDDDIESKDTKNDVPSITSTLRGRRTRKRVVEPLTPARKSIEFYFSVLFRFKRKYLSLYSYIQQMKTKKTPERRSLANCESVRSN